MGIHVYSQTQIKIDTATIKFSPKKKSAFVVYAKCTDITMGETQFMYEQLVLYATCFDPLSWCVDV